MSYRFEGFELDRDRFELRHNGVVRRVQPKTLEILFLLVDYRDRLVTKDEIIDRIWEGRAISDSALSSQIKALRKILSDNGRDQRFVQTVYGKGFRFVARSLDQDPATAANEPLSHTDGAIELRKLADDAPTIAVLPFRYVGPAGPHSNFAEALPDELITALSRLRLLRVISRGSSFQFPSTITKPLDLYKELGARYAVFGTVEIHGDKMTVKVEFVDTRDGTIIWTEQFETKPEGVHEIRQKIVAHVISGAEIHVSNHEAARARLVVPNELTAWQAYHLGVSHLFMRGSVNTDTAKQYFKQALAIDPLFARAHASLSHSYWWHILQRAWDNVGDAPTQMLQSAEAAIVSDPLDPSANLARGRAASLLGDQDAAIMWMNRALEFNPNYAVAHGAIGNIYAFLGSTDRAEDHISKAIALSPQDPWLHSLYATRAASNMMDGKFDEAARWGRESMKLPHRDLMVMVAALCSNFVAGQKDDAAKIAQQIKKTHPHVTAAGIARVYPMMASEYRDMLTKIMIANGFK